MFSFFVSKREIAENNVKFSEDLSSVLNLEQTFRCPVIVPRLKKQGTTITEFWKKRPAADQTLMMWKEYLLEIVYTEMKLVKQKIIQRRILKNVPSGRKISF